MTKLDEGLGQKCPLKTQTLQVFETWRVFL